MSHYELIGFDMDGTILNSQKTISHRTLEAVNRAARMENASYYPPAAVSASWRNSGMSLPMSATMYAKAAP